MSRIFDAYKKQGEVVVDLAREVSQIGFKPLFPSPTEVQQADFYKLSNRLLGVRSGSNASVLGFASTTSGEGASFVSYNAAVILAQVYHQKVAWVDGNFLSPHAKLNAGDGIKFGSLLQDPNQVEGMQVDINPFPIGAGIDLTKAKGLLASEKYSQVIDGLARRFDFVIIDFPPVLETSETALMAARCDGFLLVIEQKYLKWEVVEHGLGALREKDVRVLGSVINRREFSLPKIIYDRL